jgi:putative transposase
MNEYRHGSHGVLEIRIHPVWVTKYRKPVLVGPVGGRARELIREVCGSHDVQVLEGHISRDHVHLLLSIPPGVAIGRLVQRPKGETAYAMLQESAPLRKEFRGRHLWARGYFCCGTGDVTDEARAA